MKKIYKVKFKEFLFDGDKSAYKVVNQQRLELEVEKDGTLLIYEEDIPKAITYGNGLLSIDYIGRVQEHTIAYIEYWENFENFKIRITNEILDCTWKIKNK
jgi:hypothetical protein